MIMSVIFDRSKAGKHERLCEKSNDAEYVPLVRGLKAIFRLECRGRCDVEDDLRREW